MYFIKLQHFVGTREYIVENTFREQQDWTEGLDLSIKVDNEQPKHNRILILI